MSSNVRQGHKLSSDFFQLLAKNRADGLRPILQIMHSRPFGFGNRITLCLSDGNFHYGAFLLPGDGIRKYKLNKMEKSRSIVKVLGFRSHTTLRDNVKKIQLRISDFELLVEDSPIIGNPKLFSGIPEGNLVSRIDKSRQVPVEQSNFRSPPEEASRVVGNLTGESSEDNTSIVPISSINPFSEGWKIRGVITYRNAPRSINTLEGRCQVFNFYLTDKEGTEIKVSCFGDMAAQLNGLIEEWSSYTIKGNAKALRSANEKYDNTGHGYEIIIRDDVEIVKCQDSVLLPPMEINRVRLSEIKKFLRKSVEVVAVVDNIGEPVDRNTKFGMKKVMNVSLIDESATVVNLDVWEDCFNEFTRDFLHKTVILKGVTVDEFRGVCKLKFHSRSRVIKPGSQRIVRDISNWYARERSNIQISNLPSNTDFDKNVTLHSAIVSCLNGNVRRGEYFNVVGRVSKVEKLFYKACHQKDCWKAVTYENGKYQCPKCGNTSDGFIYVLLVVFEISDHSGSHWAIIFNEKAEEFLNKTTSEVMSIIEAHGEIEGSRMVVSSLKGTIHNFNIKYKIEPHKEDEVVKWSVANVKPVSLAKYAKYLREMCDNADEFCFERGM
uniref:Replication protein A subunit n=1 Tax=Strongyloides papillosus TaxID=174720 RepID=A0A0N5CC92_STREA